MRKVLLAGLAIAMLAVNAPAAQAAHYDHVGGCRFTAVTDVVAGEGQMTGEIDVEAVVYSTDPESNPVDAGFYCYIRVNGVPQGFGAEARSFGTVAVLGGNFVTYTSNSVDDFVELCQTVTYTGGTGSETVSECFEAETFEIPPPLIWEIVDPIVCQVLPLLAPGVPGVVDINSQGDVWLTGTPFFDCPPYDMDWDN